jgi:hypothetical protein
VQCFYGHAFCCLVGKEVTTQHVVHGRSKRGSWDGYNMDKSWKEIIELR